MKQTPYPIFLMGFVLIGILAACNMPFTLKEQPETGTTSQIVSPTNTATFVPTATKTLTPATATPKIAPFCEPGAVMTSQCQLPIAEQTSLFCTNKSPYNLIMMNEGATYEVLHEHIQCSDAGMKDGRQMVTCTGPLAMSFDLRVCDQSCSVPPIQPEIFQCPQGYNFNPFQGCCTQEPPPTDQSCVVLKLKTKSCIVDCGEYTNKTSCTNYGYACIWNETNSKCQLRK